MPGLIRRRVDRAGNTPASDLDLAFGKQSRLSPELPLEGIIKLHDRGLDVGVEILLRQLAEGLIRR